MIIAEVKSGKDATPNRVWRSARTSPDVSQAISYIVRFIGLHPETEVDDVAKSLGQTFRHEDDRLRFWQRPIIGLRTHVSSLGQPREGAEEGDARPRRGWPPCRTDLHLLSIHSPDSGRSVTRRSTP